MKRELPAFFRLTSATCYLSKALPALSLFYFSLPVFAQQRGYQGICHAISGVSSWFVARYLPTRAKQRKLYNVEFASTVISVAVNSLGRAAGSPLSSFADP
jgi:hypothetical protein